MRIDAIKNGIVIDHIDAGRAMKIYEMLGLDKLECPVALLKNVPSEKMGKKDIIKIDGEVQINLDVLGFLGRNITVVFVKNGTVAEKKHIELPAELRDIISCKNPRCITSTEQGIHHHFRLENEKTGVYRCVYCDAQADIS
jgi:aspartate carbamoyltransferase regulatory subunit